MARWSFWKRGGAVVPDSAKLRVRESTDDEDREWRAVYLPGTGGAARDLPPSDWRALLREAYKAYCTNPLAYAVIEQGTNFVLGGGVRVVAKDPRVQRAVDRFWHDADNRMDLRVYAIQTELALFGEQFIRYFVDPLTGRTVIRQLDPLHVEAIETDPDDVERPLRFLYRPPVESGQESEGGWIAASEIAHFAINRVSNATRGRSDLAPLLPWLRHYRDWLTDRVNLNHYRSAFAYDVTVAGAQRSEIERLRAEHAAPLEPGTVLFHNESETWQAVQPQINADDVKDDGRALRLMIAAGAGVPEHYLSEGGNANRATAVEMGLPAIKRFQRRQEYLRRLLTHLVDRALAEQVRAGALGPRAERTFTVEFDELGTAGTGELGPAAASFTGALATAADRGWVTDEEARRLWWRFTGEANQER